VKCTALVRRLECQASVLTWRHGSDVQAPDMSMLHCASSRPISVPQKLGFTLIKDLTNLKHGKKILQKSKHFHGDIEDNVEWFFPEHRVVATTGYGALTHLLAVLLLYYMYHHYHRQYKRTDHANEVLAVKPPHTLQNWHLYITLDYHNITTCLITCLITL